MKNTLIVIGVIVLILLFTVVPAISSYNGMVSRQEGVNTAWAQVQNVYQRRADLIPNLVETVKGYATFEKSTLEAVIQARANATKINVSPEKLDAASLQQFQSAQNNVGAALGRLMVVVEKYPELKANQNFLELQAQLEGTENRITVERQKFNEVAMSYNTYIRSFPKNIFAGMFGFEKKAYFEAAAGSEKAPQVKF
ncbi:MAG: LemA family protein [Bacteroidota bacterium]